MFSQQRVVLSAMLPSIRLPWLSAGIWPETKIWAPATMACDWRRESAGGKSASVWGFLAGWLGTWNELPT